MAFNEVPAIKIVLPFFLIFRKCILSILARITIVYIALFLMRCDIVVTVKNHYLIIIQ